MLCFCLLHFLFCNKSCFISIYKAYLLSFALIPYSHWHPLAYFSMFLSVFVLRKITFQNVKGVIWIIRKQEKFQQELMHCIHFLPCFLVIIANFFLSLVKWVRLHWECSVCIISFSHNNNLTMLIILLSSLQSYRNWGWAMKLNYMSKDTVN